MRITERQRNQDLAAELAKRTGLATGRTDTGGGCDAIMVTLPGQWATENRPYVLITAQLDASVPLHEDGTYAWGVHVGAYPADDDGAVPDSLLDLPAHAAEMVTADEMTTNIVEALAAWRTAQDAAEVDARPAGTCYCDVAGWCAVCDEAATSAPAVKVQCPSCGWAHSDTTSARCARCRP